MIDIKKKLQDEITALEYELHVELPKEILKARAHGDLSENAEYHAAKDRQGFVNARLGQLKKRLVERNLELRLDDSALDLLSEAGYDPVYGARPLKRAIQQQVENPLAQAILSGKFLPGDRIRASSDNGALRFERASS